MVETVADISAALEDVSLEENGDQSLKVVPEEDKEDVRNRHRKEKKEMKAEIQELKKNTPKSDKKKRKEILDQMLRMELDLEERHAAELKSFDARLAEIENNINSKSSANNGSILEEDCDSPQEGNAQLDSTQTRVSKAQRRRDKKEQEARELRKRIEAAAEEALSAPKAIEQRQLAAKLKERSLALHEIHSDGDCLYNAVRHQLKLTARGDYSLAQLRLKTANYIRANKDSLIWYMTDPKTNETLNDAEFEAYCEAVQSTPTWGGQVELKALSSALKVPIEVIQADGGSVVQGAIEFAGPYLLIVYHRHMYSLGEHYNSTVPASENDVEQEDSF